MTDAEIQLNDPQTLYRHWEEQQWNPFEIDLERDKEQWPAMEESDNALAYWALSSLMVAEERIATKFSGLVMAYDSEEEESFLASQQVDEVRHMQFYKRFQDEAIAEPGTIAAHVERAREELGEDFRRIFDEALVGAHERLAANPGDAAAKVEFVTIYHMVIEGTLGLTAFNFIVRYLRERERLPGFVEGYGRVHRDEQRHIGYGTWYLQQAVEAEPALAERVRRTLRDLLPAVASSLTPPDRDGADWDALGASSEEIRDFAIGGLSRRLAIIGVPLESL